MAGNLYSNNNISILMHNAVGPFHEDVKLHPVFNKWQYSWWSFVKAHGLLSFVNEQIIIMMTAIVLLSIGYLMYIAIDWYIQWLDEDQLIMARQMLALHVELMRILPELRRELDRYREMEIEQGRWAGRAVWPPPPSPSPPPAPPTPLPQQPESNLERQPQPEKSDPKTIQPKSRTNSKSRVEVGTSNGTSEVDGLPTMKKPEGTLTQTNH